MTSMMCKLENRAAVDQLDHPALALLAAQPHLFARQGSVSAYWRRRGQRTYGPYYRLRYRDGRCARTLYLGRASPLVDRVRQTLHALQTPLRQDRAICRFQCQVRKTLRVDRRQLDAHLRPLGLRLKGFEVRGWRTRLLRSLVESPPSPTPRLPSNHSEPSPTTTQRTFNPDTRHPLPGNLGNLYRLYR
jgi:hypothetical protein